VYPNLSFKVLYDDYWDCYKHTTGHKITVNIFSKGRKKVCRYLNNFACHIELEIGIAIKFETNIYNRLRHNFNNLLATKVSNNFKIVEEGYFVNFFDVKSGLEN